MTISRSRPDRTFHPIACAQTGPAQADRERPRRCDGAGQACRQYPRARRTASPRTGLLLPLRACDRRAASGDIAEAGSQRLQRVQISSRARLAAHRHRCARASPQVATGEHVEERHERDKAEQGPRQLRTAPDITAGRQVNPYEDHGDGMEETDQELEDLLHYLNLPWGAAGACPVPALRCQESAAVRRMYAVFTGPAHEEPGAPSVTPRAARSQVQRTSSCRGQGCPGHQARVAGQRVTALPALGRARLLSRCGVHMRSV